MVAQVCEPLSQCFSLTAHFPLSLPRWSLRSVNLALSAFLSRLSSQWLYPDGRSGLWTSLSVLFSHVSVPSGSTRWSLRSVGTRGGVRHWTPDKWSLTDALGLLKIFELWVLNIVIYINNTPLSNAWVKVWAAFNNSLTFFHICPIFFYRI